MEGNIIFAGKPRNLRLVFNEICQQRMCDEEEEISTIRVIFCMSRMRQNLTLYHTEVIDSVSLAYRLVGRRKVHN